MTNSSEEAIMIIKEYRGQMQRTVRGIVTGVMVLLLSVSLVIGISFLASVKLVKVSGNSMNPTYSDGDLLVTSNVNPRNGDVALKKDDVVVLVKPSSWTLNHEDKRPDIVKRIVVVGPSTVELDGDGRLREVGSNGGDTKLIDSRENEVDLPECKTGFSRTMDVPKGYMLIRGDNVNNSYDSRWAWCNGEDPLVPVSSIFKMVDHNIPLGSLMGKLTGNHKS